MSGRAPRDSPLTDNGPAQSPSAEGDGAEPVQDPRTLESTPPTPPRAGVGMSDRPPVEEMPRVRLTRGRIVASLLFVASTVAFLYFVLPKLLGLRDTWSRIQHGDPAWLGVAALLEVCSFGGYVILFRGVFVRGRTRIGWRASYEITMAGLAATRLFASAGAGGVALTAWALRRSGMEPRTVACRMIAFMALLYGVFMGALVIVGFGLYFFGDESAFAITVIPAIFGAAVILIFLAVSFLPGDVDRLVKRWSRGGRLGRLAGHAAAAPAAAASGVRTAIELVRERNPALFGALGWWGFDIGVLWACFHAFGGSPQVAVVVMAYFLGQLGNVLPLPGGIGGVDGAMIGAFSALGVSSSLAVVSVLAYRAFAFWLPTLPGAVAYLQLRRRVHRWQDTESNTSYTL
jgi:putative heme transporter